MHARATPLRLRLLQCDTGFCVAWISRGALYKVSGIKSVDGSVVSTAPAPDPDVEATAEKPPAWHAPAGGSRR
jgi:hypothetical protein